MKIISILLITIIGLTISYPMDIVIAHNGLDEQVDMKEIYNQWNFMMAGTLIVILTAYVYKFKEDGDFIKKFSFFFSALVVLYIAIGTPLHILGDYYLFSAHMLEQSLVYIGFPPLLLLGLPKRFIAPIIQLGLRMKVFKFIKYPLIPLFLFNVLFSFYHIPLLFNTIIANNVLHNLTHIILTLSAFAMWIPLIPIVKEVDTLSEIQKIGYIFAAGILLTPACALIIFTNQPFYTIYIDAPQLFAALPPLEDQKTGGIIMKVIQEIVYGTIIGYVFNKWARKERVNDIDELPINRL